MKALAAFAIVLLGPLVVTEGSPKLDERIVGGQEAARNTIPWQVALVDLMSSEPFKPRCGGTILCSRYIMTAAHCTHRKFAWQFKVIAGEHNHVATDGTETAHRVKKIIDHPSYYQKWKDGFRHGFDFSILELEDPIDLSSNSYARPACLPSSYDTDFNENTRFNVSGWGRLSGSEAGPRSLHQVTLPWVPASALESLNLVAWVTTTPRRLNSMMCAGNMEWGGVSPCMGDSGGPLTWKDPSTSRTKLVGVVSFGPKDCGIRDSANVFGKVTAVLPWIQRTTGNCSSAYSSTCGITPPPRQAPPKQEECDMYDVLTGYDYYTDYINQIEWFEMYNPRVQGSYVEVKLKCDWDLRCQVVSGGWSNGKTACEKICGYPTCEEYDDY